MEGNNEKVIIKETLITQEYFEDNRRIWWRFR